MLLEFVIESLRKRGLTQLRASSAGHFADVFWDPHPGLDQIESGVLIEGEDRYVVLSPFPEGIRYFAAPAPVGREHDSANTDVWELGTLPSLEAAEQFVNEWLVEGVPAGRLSVPRIRRSPPSTPPPPAAPP